MNYTLKLIIPLVLGVVAALVNMMILNARLQPVQFIKVTRDIARGEVFTAEDLTTLEFPGPVGKNLTETAMPFESVGALVGQAALRGFFQGDIVFYRDFELQGQLLPLEPGEAAQRLTLEGLDVPPAILRVGYKLDFLLPEGDGQPQRWIGPFRLVSIGDRVSNSSEQIEQGGTADTVTIAVKQDRSKCSPEEREELEALDRFAALQQQDQRQFLNVQISQDK